MNYTVKLRLSGKTIEFVNQQQTLLDTLEQHQIQMDYQCRSGYCGACRTLISKGKVVYKYSPLAFIRQGEILPCCCIPQADIELEM